MITDVRCRLLGVVLVWGIYGTARVGAWFGRHVDSRTVFWFGQVDPS